MLGYTMCNDARTIHLCNYAWTSPSMKTQKMFSNCDLTDHVLKWYFIKMTNYLYVLLTNKAQCGNKVQ